MLMAGWAIYFALHSVFASDAVKQFFKQSMPAVSRFYRIIYNVIFTLGLLVMLVLNASIPSAYLIEPSSWTRYFSLMLATVGIFIFRAAFRQYDSRGFMGLRDDEQEVFKAGGILKKVRHPIYLATLFIVAGFWLFIPNVTTLVSAGCILVYLAIGIPLEERKLIRKYGDAYRQYRKDVPALIPRLWKG